MFINRLIALLLVLLVFSACSKPSDDTKILINIENEFTVSMVETLSPAVNPLNIRITTIELLDCSNYEIIYSQSTSDESVITSIDYLEEPENCIDESVQATSDIRVGRLENGSYLFQLNLEKGSIINEGILTVDNEMYSIELETEHGIDFPIKSLNKIPDNYIWGQINLAPDAPNNVMNELLDELNQLTEESALSPGDYGHFKIKDNYDFSFQADKALSFSPRETNSFILKLPATEIALISLLENYRDTYGDMIDIQLITSKGEVL